MQRTKRESVSIPFMERVNLLRPIPVEVTIENDGSVHIWWKGGLLYGVGKTHRLAYEMFCREVRSFAKDIVNDHTKTLATGCRQGRGFVRYVKVPS
jgi:hypothetical protein